VYLIPEVQCGSGHCALDSCTFGRRVDVYLKWPTRR